MNYSSKTRVRLAGSAAILALSAGAALAQQSEGVEQVVVSSTRLQNAGFDAPTPTTVVSAADLETQAKPNVFDAITQLPALQGSTGVGYNTGSTTTGLIGLSALGLRGLSPLRTLVLIDGQRVVGGNFNGVVDVSQLPQMLIQRVDVVTGGASASWGSDAVAGVVNFVTDKKFEGFKMNAQAGLSTYGDMGTATYQMAAGTSFLGGRGHVEMAGEYSYSDGLLPRFPVSTQFGQFPENLGGRQLSRLSGTANYGASATGIPAGQPQSFYGPLAQFTQQGAYGIITNGPLNGTTFGAPNQPYRIALAGGCQQNPTTGAITATQVNGLISNTCFGTSAQPGDQGFFRGFNQGLYDPLTRGDIYLRTSYDLSPSTEIYATLNYGAARTENIPAQGNSDRAGLSYQCDNAYLPSTNLFGQGLNAAQTQAACLASYPTGSFQYATKSANIPRSQLMFLNRSQRRYVVGGDGTFSLFGKDWSWDSYFQHGESDTGIKIMNMPLSGAPPAGSAFSRYNMAQDAVVGANGAIVCRNATARLNGCVPFNPFGNVDISPAALAYFDGQNGPGGTTVGPTAIQTQRQEAFSFAVNGAPIKNWAGDVSVAAGYEYREEHYSQRADPYSAGISASTPATVNEPCTDPSVDCTGLGAWNAGNYHNGRGTYHVNEVFVEVGVPLLNDNFWGKADLDLAGRHARYSTAGDANTWKVGLTWDTPLPGVRLRALQSRDVRAPNLSELFSPVQGLNGSFNNDFQNAVSNGTGNNQSVRQLNEGNVLLKPERSQTTQMGIVYQPDFLPGFQASVDYYRIAVKGVVSALSLQQVEDQCFQGFAQFCGQDAITTANGQPQTLASTGAVGTANVVTAVHSKAFNAASLTTDGFDIEASYQFDLQDFDLPGNVVLRSLVNHVSKFISDSGIVGTQRNSELAGNLGGGGNSQTYNQSGGNVLTWKLQETQSYQNDVWGVNLTERWYADGTFTNKNTIVCAPGTCPSLTTAQLVQTPTINYNYVPAVFYLDVGANWNVSDRTQIYVKVDNVANKLPPDTGGATVNNTLYDVIGRMYRIGVRFSD